MKKYFLTILVKIINAAKVKIYTRLFARKKANNFNSDKDKSIDFESTYEVNIIDTQ